MASFFVIRGKDHGQHFAIRPPMSSIGREASNQIKLNDTEVSRQHAVVVRTDDDAFEIRDLDSSNGTFVNSRRIDKHLLHSGDRIQVGRTLMIFTGGPEPHSTRTANGVEIVTTGNEDQLSQIRQSLESQIASVVPLNSGFKEPVDSSAQLVDATAPTATFNDWEIVYQVSQAISRTVDLNELLIQVLDLIFQWIECDRGCVMMLDDVTAQLVPTYSRDRRQAADPEGQRRSLRKLQISRTILDHVVATKEGVLTSNAQDDTRWQNVESISNLGVNEAICVPMLGRFGLVGAIYVDTEISPGLYAERQGKACFDEPHLKLMIAIAGQAALAIEDTQFYRAMLQSERLAAMGQTIANLSHHVKNILQGISGGSYLVDDGLKHADLDVVRRGWHIVEKNQERISNLVMDMLSFSKEREPELKSGDVRRLIQDVVELMSSRAQEAGVQLTGSLPESPLIAMFDSEAMHRALLNVVTNAIDAAKCTDHPHARPPLVDVSAQATPEKGLVCIRVVDNGSGIDPEDQQRIFSPFESSKGASGTGLGLPVSRKVLREHGGDIEVESQLGQGTTFSLHWPIGSTGDSAEVSKTITQPG